MMMIFKKKYIFWDTFTIPNYADFKKKVVLFSDIF